jgi:hypothetical protein
MACLARRRPKNSFFWAPVVPHLHQGPGADDEFLNGRADPPHGVGGQTEAAIGVEATDRLHQADVALGDQVGDRQAVAAVTHGDLGHQAQVRGDQPLGGVGVVVLLPPPRQHVFVLRLQHGHFADLAQIPAETLFGRERDGGLHDGSPPQVGAANALAHWEATAGS